MGVYKHCEYRNSWDCEDGYCNCENCDQFKLDFDTLTKKQQKAIKRIYTNICKQWLRYGTVERK